MATTNPTNRRQAGVRLRCLVRRYRAVIAAAVEGIALLLRLPLVAHVLLAMATELAIAMVTGRRRRA